MSDFRAIGGVSSTLQTLLMDRMELPEGLTGVPVTIGPPPFTAKDNELHREDAQINLFLYRVTENGFLQNQEIPGRGTGNGFGHPPLSLDLHYLVTAYGNVEKTFNGATLLDDTTAHQLLGSAMRVLHDSGIVTEALRTTRPPSGLTILHPSLRDAYEQVKLTLEPLTLEDVTKVWTALALRYRLSAAYIVNVVQIESRRPTTFPRPVGQPTSSAPPLPTDPPSPGPWVYTLPIQAPTITAVTVRRLGDTAEQPLPYARIGDTLVIRGTSLTGPVTEGAFGDLVVPATVAAPDVVEVRVPDATLPNGGPIREDLVVQPGVRTLQVRHRDPLVPHSSVSSNHAPIMVVPGVDPAQVGYLAGPPRQVRLVGSRLVSRSPGGETIIGRAAVPRTAYLSATATGITVPIPTTLPERGVRLVLGAPLPDPVPIGAGPPTLTVAIGGVTLTSSPASGLPPTLPRADVVDLVSGLVHDARPAPPAPPDPRFTAARVELWGDQLVLVPGDLTSSIVVTGGTLGPALGLTAAQPAGAGSAAVSGLLGTPPLLSAPDPRVAVTIGAQTRTVEVTPGLTRLADLAASMETAVRAAGGGVGFSQARVGTSAGQLVLLPGAAGAVSFAAVPGDDTTVVELQWHARFAVRVRCNGAESIDPASVELPQ
jgi:Pvc16 N-terminal domain